MYIIPLMNAIKQIRGVQSVTPNVASIDSHIATSRAKHELSRQIWEVVKP